MKIFASKIKDLTSGKKRTFNKPPHNKKNGYREI